MKINVTPKEFFGIVLMYLLDKYNNPDKIAPWDDETDKIMDKFNVLKPTLTSYYLSSDPNEKINYKRIRDVFQKTDFAGSYIISIKDKHVSENEEIDKEQLNDNEYFIKDVIKETISKIRKRKFHKSTYLSEGELDKIIIDVIKNKRSGK